jgi:hypothetical protein
MKTYTWFVTSMNTFPKIENRENVVTEIRFIVNGTDGVDTAIVNSFKTIEFNNSESFTHYENLTESQVIGWLKDSLGESGQKNIIAEIDAILDQKKNVQPLPVNIPLPWKSDFN